MSNFVMATAGHIDHGKTTLIKRLTGIETDRTKEEKERGMSINLGFAYWNLPDGKQVGVVDVPGHERFVKNMVAGLSGIHLVLLTIDVNEGMMPQTKEHLAILRLLGIRRVLIALTKCDTVDDEWVELMQGEIEEELASTPFKDAPIVQTDAVTGRGIDELTKQVMAVIDEIQLETASSLTRLNVDRSFSVKGFGTVVTGTLMGGKVQQGDSLYVYPGNRKVRVRNIQVHEQDVDCAENGMRTALNLASISVDEIRRGAVLTTEVLQPTFMLDAKVSVLPDSITSLFQWQRVRVLIGTHEVMARVVPLGCETIEAGSEGYVQLRLEEEVVCQRKDRFIIRSYSPIFTIAGGEVVDEKPSKHRKHDESVVDRLALRTSSDGKLLVDDYCAHQAQGWQTVAQIAKQTDLANDECQSVVEQLCEAQQLLQCHDLYIHAKQAQGMSQRLLLALGTFHKKNRLLMGMPVQQFNHLFEEDWSTVQKEWLLQQLMDARAIKMVQHCVSLYDFTVRYNSHQQKEYHHLKTQLDEQQFMVTPIETIDLKNHNLKEVFEATENELYIRLDDQYIISKTYFDNACFIVESLLNQKGQFTLADFRDATHSSRKSSMLILEKLDRMNLTKRVENYRVSGKGEVA